MQWVLFTGTWRLTNDEVERDVRTAVRAVLTRGDGVLTGGSTGVDYFAMDETLRIVPAGTHLRVIIPAQLEDFITDYYTNWCHAPITRDDIDRLATLLRDLKQLNPASMLEMPYSVITAEHYLLRDTEEVMYSHEVYAFQVNGSKGTQDTIDKGLEAGLPVTVHKQYQIEEK